MIKYALACEAGHEFEGWFGASADFDDQQARGLLECPVCATKSVRKQIMAPAVAGTKKRELSESPEARALLAEAITQVRKHVEDNFDYVGDSFAKEARAIHEGKSEERAIYGEATPAEVKKMTEDGVPVSPLPGEPVKPDKLN